MMDRLRNRDLRTSINKCYSIYFDDNDTKRDGDGDGPGVTATVAAVRKSIKSKSPRKRETAKDNCENELSADKVIDSCDNGDHGESNTNGVDKMRRRSCEDGIVAIDNGLDKDVAHNNVDHVATTIDIDASNEDNNNRKQCDDDADNSRKRRLSMCSDASGGGSGSYADSIENIGPNPSKRAKTDSLKELMFQVRHEYRMIRAFASHAIHIANIMCSQLYECSYIKHVHCRVK